MRYVLLSPRLAVRKLRFGKTRDPAQGQLMLLDTKDPQRRRQEVINIIT